MPHPDADHGELRTLTTDVLVVGAGLAGLTVARRLAESGHQVLLLERHSTLTTTVRTTGIFVRRTLDDFTLPPEHLGPPIRRVTLYPPAQDRAITLDSDRDEFRVGDMGPLYVEMARAATAAGVRILLGTRYTGRRGDRHSATGPRGPILIRAAFVVGADGARSRVARDLGLDRNRHLLIGAEEVFPIPSGTQQPTFHCVLDPRLAPGYLAWVVNDGEQAHVGVAGYASRFPDGIQRALRRFSRTAPGLEDCARPEEVERRAGPIPVGGILRRIATADGLLVGDAAGAVSPLTAGGLDPCLRLSEHAAEVIDEALRRRTDVVGLYDGAALRRRFRGRLALRRALALVRTPAMAEAAFAALRTPPGQAAARTILFGDRSFPDPR